MYPAKPIVAWRGISSLDVVHRTVLVALYPLCPCLLSGASVLATPGAAQLVCCGVWCGAAQNYELLRWNDIVYCPPFRMKPVAVTLCLFLPANVRVYIRLCCIFLVHLILNVAALFFSVVTQLAVQDNGLSFSYWAGIDEVCPSGLAVASCQRRVTFLHTCTCYHMHTYEPMHQSMPWPSRYTLTPQHLDGLLSSTSCLGQHLTIFEVRC